MKTINIFLGLIILAGLGYATTSYLHATSGDDIGIETDGTPRLIVYDSGSVSVGGEDDGVFNVVNNETYTYVRITTYDNGATYPQLSLRKSDTDTLGTKTQTDSGDTLGQLIFLGVNNAAAFKFGANIQADQVGASGTFIPTDLTLYAYNETGVASTVALKSDGTVEVSVLNITGILYTGDLCFKNGLCDTECVTGGVDDICTVKGFPTSEQEETMMLLGFKDYTDYNARPENDTLKQKAGGSLTFSEFYNKRNKAFKAGKLDLTFNREVVVRKSEVAEYMAIKDVLIDKGVIKQSDIDDKLVAGALIG